MLLSLLACGALGTSVATAGAEAKARKGSFEYELLSAPAAHHARCTAAQLSSTRSVHGRAAVRCPASSAPALARRGATAKPRRPPARHVSRPSAATAQLAGTLARVLATPCQNTEVTPEAANLALVRAAVLCLVNRERAHNGVGPLTADANLEAAAQAHVQDMLNADYFDHISPTGSTPVDRVRASGYIPQGPSGYVIGENLAWGTLSLSTAQAIVSAWIASPGHLANILESQYHNTGIAIAAQVPQELASGVAGATYGQEFGVITR
jgi:uncharacterized protein YkwD